MNNYFCFDLSTHVKDPFYLICLTSGRDLNCEVHHETIVRSDIKSVQSIRTVFEACLVALFKENQPSSTSILSLEKDISEIKIIFNSSNYSGKLNGTFLNIAVMIKNTQLIQTLLSIFKKFSASDKYRLILKSALYDCRQFDHNDPIFQILTNEMPYPRIEEDLVGSSWYSNILFNDRKVTCSVLVFPDEDTNELFSSSLLSVFGESPSTPISVERNINAIIITYIYYNDETPSSCRESTFLNLALMRQDFNLTKKLLSIFKRHSSVERYKLVLKSALLECIHMHSGSSDLITKVLIQEGAPYDDLPRERIPDPNPEGPHQITAPHMLKGLEVYHMFGEMVMHNRVNMIKTVFAYIKEINAGLIFERIPIKGLVDIIYTYTNPIYDLVNQRVHYISPSGEELWGKSSLFNVLTAISYIGDKRYKVIKKSEEFKELVNLLLDNGADPDLPVINTIDAVGFYECHIRQQSYCKWTTPLKIAKEKIEIHNNEKYRWFVEEIEKRRQAKLNLTIPIPVCPSHSIPDERDATKVKLPN